MSQLLALGRQVFPVQRVRHRFDRYPFHNTQTIPLEADDLPRVVRHQADITHPEILQNLRPGPILPHVRAESQLHIRLDRVETLVLETVREIFVR